MKTNSSQRVLPNADANTNANLTSGYPRIPWTRLAIVVLLFGAPLPALLPAQIQTAQPRTVTSATAPATRPFTDELGRRVDVPANVNRIVSLAPNLTEIVFALGDGDRLAGDTDYCDYPPAAMQKPHVGGTVNPNLEQIVALTPDLILATKIINRRETVDALARLGLAVYVTVPDSVDQMIASLERLGQILHTEQTAQPLVLDLRARLADLDRRMAGAVPRRVLFVVWTDPLISIGQKTFIADALRRAGARSVVDTNVEWPRIGLEEIVRLQPEVVIFASAHAEATRQEIEALRAQPGWRDINALRQGNVVIVSDAINRPAPRMVDAIEQLARTLHPESFPPAAGRSRSVQPAVEEACACAR
jgi:iron complex transport system substrate-binding protein